MLTPLICAAAFALLQIDATSRVPPHRALTTYHCVPAKDCARIVGQNRARMSIASRPKFYCDGREI